jgi:threonine dehydratase
MLAWQRGLASSRDFVEPGGAAALAALLSGGFDARGKTIAIVLSGGNIDPEMLIRCIDSGAGMR